MAYEIEYIDEDRVVITSHAGSVTDETLLKSIRERLFYVKDTGDFRYFITDFSKVTEYHVTPECVRKAALMAVMAINPNHNIYMVVVTPTDLVFGMTRMWQAYADCGDNGCITNVVRSLDEAHAWVDVYLNDSTSQLKNETTEIEPESTPPESQN